ncbi:hypothetical protein GCM10011404_17600 [Sphingomonas prati]|nr:hypothetical protein GCM10011404_17600 [Sphingomonas prati]
MLAWLGPFDTDDQEPFVRLGFWIAMSVAWFTLSSIALLVFARSMRLKTLPAPVRRLLPVVATALVGMAIAGFALHHMDGWEPDVQRTIDLFLKTLLVGLIVETIGTALLERPARQEIPFGQDSTDRESETVQPDNFPEPVQDVDVVDAPLARIPPALREMIICLQMEDHYVRAHTDHGSSLFLMRLSDAMEELGQVKGMRVHRSWWVASDAIVVVERSGRAAQLTLRNGLKVPVSTPYIAPATAAVSARTDRLP